MVGWAVGGDNRAKSSAATYAVRILLLLLLLPLGGRASSLLYTPTTPRESRSRSRILRDSLESLAVFARRQWTGAGRRAGRAYLRVAARASVRHNVCTAMISRPALRVDAFAAIDKIRR